MACCNSFLMTAGGVDPDRWKASRSEVAADALWMVVGCFRPCEDEPSLGLQPCDDQPSRQKLDDADVVGHSL